MIRSIALLMVLALPASASAQLLPQVPSLPSLPGPVGGAVDGVRRALPVEETLSNARQLVRQSVERARDLARRYPDRIELDRDGNPVRAGEVTLTDPDPAMLAAAQAAGFRVIESEWFEELGIGFARLRVPPGLSAVEAVRRLGRIFGGGAGGDRSVVPGERGGASCPSVTPMGGPPRRERNHRAVCGTVDPGTSPG